MVRIHLISTLTLFFTLLAQMLSTEGREIKSPTMKFAPQKTTTNFPQTITYDKNFPSLEATRKLPKNNNMIDSSSVKKVDSDEQGDCYFLNIHDDYHPLAPEQSINLPPGRSSTNQTPKSPKIWRSISSSADDYGHTTPVHNQGAGRAKEINNELNLKNTVGKTPRSPPSFFFTASAMAHENDFRPTAPGISPGAGHADTCKYKKEESRHCLTDKCTEDFRPTAPGDSPGAGHSFVNNNDSNTSGQGNHLGVAHTQAGPADDYRPTAPGRSPGAGHPTFKEIRKPNS